MRLWERERDRFRDRCRNTGPKLDGEPPDGGRRLTARRMGRRAQLDAGPRGFREGARRIGRWGPSERNWTICLPYIVRN